MNEKEFYEYSASNAKITVEEVKKQFVVTPCSCKHPSCKGWTLFPKYLSLRGQSDKEVEK